MLNYRDVEPREPDTEIINFYYSMFKQNQPILDQSVLRGYLNYILESQERKAEYERELDILLEILEV